MTEAAAPFAERYATAPDGLKLYGRDYGPRESAAAPVVCLPGLTRNSADFDLLARALASDADNPRRVLALDLRGRGKSDRDPNWRNYDVAVELADTLSFLAAMGIGHAIFVGTSRGGLITMALSAARPAMIRGAVLNDIGPVLEPQGLVRIRSYVGKLPVPANLVEAVAMLKQVSADHFTHAEQRDWQQLAEATWRDEGGRLVLNYDPALMHGLSAINLEAPLPTMWPLFEGLAPFPCLVIRGANSDLLSAATVAEMKARHPRLQSFDVPGQGHAPFLNDRASIARIQRFVAEADSADRN
jgi:pimeloyl-ACP methyl ester carboxylesterase